MIITVGNVKGGVGKSTFASNIAIALSYLDGEAQVLLIDGDSKQGSSSLFQQARVQGRSAGGYTCVRAVEKEVGIQIQSLRDKYQHIIVDVGGQDNKALRSGLVHSDTVLIPVAPQAFEVWAMDSIRELVEEASSLNPKLKPVVFLNKAFSSGSDNSDTLKILEEDHGSLSRINTPVIYRKVWSNASAEGLSILEVKKRDCKALYEFRAVLKGLGLDNKQINKIYEKSHIDMLSTC